MIRFSFAGMKRPDALPYAYKVKTRMRQYTSYFMEKFNMFWNTNLLLIIAYRQ